MTTAFDPDLLLRLWLQPISSTAAAEDAFRAVYTDPVTVNGAPISAANMVQRAIALQSAIEAPERHIIDIADAGDKVAIAFRLRGRHVGPFNTSAGTLPPTGRTLEIRVIDILTFTGGLISEIAMVSDELGALHTIGAVRLLPGQQGG